MKTLVCCVLTFFMLCCVSAASEYEIRERYPSFSDDLNFQAGGIYNPYEVTERTDSGEVNHYEMRPQYPSWDETPETLQPGGFNNPYIIEDR